MPTVITINRPDVVALIEQAAKQRAFRHKIRPAVRVRCRNV